MNASAKVQQVKDTLAGARIAKDTRENIDHQLRALCGGQPVSVDTVPNPLVNDDWYGADRYWNTHDRADARPLTPVYPEVRAVRIDSLSDDDLARQRTPGSWYPRVEVKFTANERTVIGDLDADQAIKLATELLAAAALVKR